MDEQLAKRTDVVLALAKGVLARAEQVLKRRGPFPRYGGSSNYSDAIVREFPAHKIYVEPFAGAAACLFTKEPADREILTDLSEEVVQALKFIKGLNDARMKELRRFDWVASRKTYDRVRASIPTTDAAKFHKFVYLSRFGFSGVPPFAESNAGMRIHIDNYLRFRDRLKNVEIYRMDYAAAFKRFDGKDTLFFVDPPYPGEWNDGAVGSPNKGSKFDLEPLGEILREAVGAWVLALGDTKKQKGFVAGLPGKKIKIRTRESQARERGGGCKKAWRYFAIRGPRSSKYELTEIEKKCGPFSRFGGSSRYAEIVVRRFPAHEVYVEPFAGAASCLYTKQPSKREILCDLDEDVVNAFEFIKAWSPEKEKALARFDWECSKPQYLRLMKLKPKTPAERFYRFIYLHRFGWSGQITPAAADREDRQGRAIDFRRFGRFSERLKNVEIFRMDYKETLKKFDSTKTFFFVDPPYPEEWVPSAGPQDAGPEAGVKFDLVPMVSALKATKGGWMVALGDTKKQKAVIRELGGRRFVLRIAETKGGGGQKVALRYFALDTRSLR